MRRDARQHVRVLPASNHVRVSPVAYVPYISHVPLDYLATSCLVFIARKASHTLNPFSFGVVVLVVVVAVVVALVVIVDVVDE